MALVRWEPMRELNSLPLEDFASRLEERLLSRPGARDDIAFILIAVDGQA